MKKFSSFKKKKNEEEEDKERLDDDSESPRVVVSGTEEDSSSSSSDEDHEFEESKGEEEQLKKKRKREKKKQKKKKKEKRKKLKSDAEKIAEMEEKYGRDMAKDERAFDDRSYMRTFGEDDRKTFCVEGGAMMFFSDTRPDSGNLAFGKPAPNEKVKFKREEDWNGGQATTTTTTTTTLEKLEKENGKDGEEGGGGEEEIFIPLLRDDYVDVNTNYNISHGNRNTDDEDEKRMIQKVTQTVFGATKGTIEDIYKLNDKALLESVDVLLKSTTNESEQLRELTKIHNALTRREPRNVKRWIAFINHQDNFLARSKKRSERERIKEKTIAICERALEWNPNDARLHACLLKCSQECESKDQTKERWVLTLRKLPTSVVLWYDYVEFVKHATSFAEFNCEDVVQAYEDALRTLTKEFRKLSSQRNTSSSCRRQILSRDIGNMFLELVQFEAKSGRARKAFRRVQAHLEFRGFGMPQKHIGDNSRLLREFEKFWKSKKPRLLDSVNDDGEIKSWWMDEKNGSTANDNNWEITRVQEEEEEEEGKSSPPESSKVKAREPSVKKEVEVDLGNKESDGDDSSDDDIDEDALAAEFAVEFDSAVNAAVDENTLREWSRAESAKMRSYRKDVNNDNNDDEEDFGSITAGLCNMFCDSNLADINTEFIEQCFALFGLHSLFGALIGNPDTAIARLLRNENASEDDQRREDGLFPFVPREEVLRSVRVLATSSSLACMAPFAYAAVKLERELNGPEVALAWVKSLLSGPEYRNNLHLYTECAYLTRCTKMKQGDRKKKKKKFVDPAQKIVETTIQNASRIQDGDTRETVRGLCRLVKESALYLLRYDSPKNTNIARYILALARAHVMSSKGDSFDESVPANASAENLHSLAQEAIKVLMEESSSTQLEESLKTYHREVLEFKSDMRVCAILLRLFCASSSAEQTRIDIFRDLRNLSNFALEKTCSDLLRDVIPYLSESGELAITVTDGYKEIVNALFHDVPSSQLAVNSMFKAETFESKLKLKLALGLARELCFSRAREESRNDDATQDGATDSSRSVRRRRQGAAEIFERAIRSHESVERCPLLWQTYFSSEVHNTEYARSVFLRGIRSIPYDKKFWLDGIAWNEGFSPSERANWIDMLKKKGVVAETDLYEAKLIAATGKH
ncbi:unnamed protein product [Bathycoccus prasinos]